MDNMLSKVMRKLLDLPISILGMIYDLLRKITGENKEIWLEGFKKFLREKPSGVSVIPYEKIVRSWQRFYKRVFNEAYDFSGVRIPQKPQGKWWLIIVAQGTKPQWLFDKCREMFGDAWKWTEEDLDKIVTSDRTADSGHYAVWVRASVEADPEFQNLSANQLKKKNHQGIALEERLALELFYFWKTKRHLDTQNVTLCTGSRCSDGGVPIVNFYPNSGGVVVRSFGAGYADPRLRSREIVF